MFLCLHKILSVLIKSMNAELVRLSNWFKANKLSLNTKKTSYMIFGGSKCKQTLIYSLVLEGDKLVRNSVIALQIFLE